MADKVTEKALEKEIKQVEAKAEKKLIETEKKVVAA